jgi:hypothetical protein
MNIRLQVLLDHFNLQICYKDEYHQLSLINDPFIQ